MPDEKRDADLIEQTERFVNAARKWVDGAAVVPLVDISALHASIANERNLRKEIVDLGWEIHTELESLAYVMLGLADTDPKVDARFADDMALLDRLVILINRLTPGEQKSTHAGEEHE